MEFDFDLMKEEATNLLIKLIENQCVNNDIPDSGFEMRSVRTLIEYFKSYDIKDYEVFETYKDRGNLLIRIKGSDAKNKSLCYESHLDVVPATNNWTVEPYKGMVKDGWLWGRGAIDMLYYTVTEAVSFAHLIKNGFKPKGDFVFLAVADEEAGANYGAKWLIENASDKIKTDYLIGEFGGAIYTNPANKKSISVMTSEKSPGLTRLNVKGVSGHASMPYKIPNAINIISEIIQKIRKNPPKVKITNAFREFIDAMELGGIVSKLMKNPFTINFLLKSIERRDLDSAKGLYSLTRMTITPTRINAGVKNNVISDQASCTFDIRLLPGQSWKDIENYFKRIIPKKYKDRVEIEPIQVDENFSDSWNDPFIDSLRKTLNKVFPKYPLSPLFMPAVTDARFFRKIGIKCFGFSLIGDSVDTKLLSGLAHGDDERIPLESIELSIKFFTQFAQDFLS